jgi:hypothetical protein
MITRPAEQEGVPLVMEVDSLSTALVWISGYLGLARRMTPRPAVVLDIDGTVLHVRGDRTVDCVEGFVELVKRCKENGIAVFCVTAREDSGHNRGTTYNQIAECGIAPVQKLYMRPQGGEYADYKRRARDAIRADGYEILVTVGDQFADITHLPLESLRDDRFYIGAFDGRGTFGVKLPSEFRKRRRSQHRSSSPISKAEK